MGQIDLAIFCMLLFSFFSGTNADCYLGSSRSNLSSQFVQTWSHLHCGIPHEGREHNLTRAHGLTHTPRDKACIDNFTTRLVKPFLRPVMECIGDSNEREKSKNSSRLKDSSCFEEYSREYISRITPELKELGKDLVRSFSSCCSAYDQASTHKEIRMLRSRRKPVETAERVGRCIKRKFHKLLESFNANNDPLEHLDMLVNSN